MSHEKTLAAKAFLEKVGFKNAIYTGNAKKPSEPMVVPGVLFRDDQPALKATVVGAQTLLTTLNERPKSPWEQLADESVATADEALKKQLNLVWQKEAKVLSDLRMTAEYSDDGRARNRELADTAKLEVKIKSTLWPMVKEALGFSEEVKSPSVRDPSSPWGAEIEVRPLPNEECLASMLSRVRSEEWRGLARLWCRSHPETWIEMCELNAALPRQRNAFNSGLMKTMTDAQDEAFERLKVEVEHDLLIDRVNLKTAPNKSPAL